MKKILLILAFLPGLLYSQTSIKYNRITADTIKHSLIDRLPTHPTSGFKDTWWQRGWWITDSLEHYRLITTKDTAGLLHWADTLTKIGTTHEIGKLITAAYDDKSMTGFLYGTSIDVAYSWTDRKITLTGDLTYYWRGVKHTLTSPWTSGAHTADVGKWYLASTDGINFTWSQDLWTFDIMQVSYLNYHATEAATFAGREVHELMGWDTHKELHSNIGTWLASGGTLKAGTYQENSASNPDITPGFNLAKTTDEDLTSTEAEWTEGTYTTMYVNGANSVFSVSSSYPFLVSTGSYINYNNATAGTLIEGATGKFYNVYQILIPTTSDANSQKFRMIMLQPQKEYGSLAAAQSEDTRGLHIGDLANLALEFKLYARITYTASAAHGSYGKVMIPTGGISYVLGSNASNINLSGAVIASHPNLNLLGWDASGHTGTANSLAGFNATGGADYTLKSNYQSALNGSGFVKISGTTISYDNSTYLTTETDPFHTAWLATDPVKDFSRLAGSAAYANVDAFSTFDHLHTGVYDPAGTGHTEATDHMTAHTSAFTHSNIHALHADDQDLSGYSLTNHNHNSVYELAGTTATHAAETTTAHGLGASAFHADSYFSLSNHNHSGTYLTTETDPFHTAWLATDPVKDFSRSAGSAAYANIDAFSTYDHLHTGTYEPLISKSTGYLRYTGSAWEFKNEAYSLTSHAHTGTYLTSITGTAPIVSSGGMTPAISISAATTGAAGSMSAADKLKLDGIATGATLNNVEDVSLKFGSAASADIKNFVPVLPSGTVVLNGVEYTWPSTDGANSQVITTDGNKILSWTDKEGSSSGGITSINSQQGATQTISGTAPIVVNSATNGHVVSISGATQAASGSMSSADKAKLDGIATGATANTGTVTSVSVTTANGVSGSVATNTTTPAITLALAAITPTTVNGLTLTAQSTGFTIAGGSTSKTLTVLNTASIEGSNTGDQTNISGNAGTSTLATTATKLRITGNTDNQTRRILWVDSDAGDLIAYTTSSLWFNSSLGYLHANLFNGVALSGSGTPTLAVTGTTSISGANTGDQTTTSATTNQLTVATGGSNPALSIITGAVADGATSLATGDQIRDFVIGLGYAPINSPTFTTSASLPANTVIGDLDATEIGYLSTVSSNVQTQLNGKVSNVIMTRQELSPGNTNSAVWNTTYGYNAYIKTTGSGAIDASSTISLTNVVQGASGNLSVWTSPSSYVITITASDIYSGGINVLIAPNIKTGNGQFTLSGGFDVFSWYFDGAYLWINGTKNY